MPDSKIYTHLCIFVPFVSSGMGYCNVRLFISIKMYWLHHPYFHVHTWLFYCYINILGLNTNFMYDCVMVFSNCFFCEICLLHFSFSLLLSLHNVLIVLSIDVLGCLIIYQYSPPLVTLIFFLYMYILFFSYVFFCNFCMSIMSYDFIM